MIVEAPRNDEQTSGAGALIASICNSGIGDLAVEGADIFLDLALDEGLLRDIPVFGWIVKVYGGINTVRDRIFSQKVYRFLEGVQTAPVGKRKAFVEKIESNPEYRRKVGESLFLLIDRHETAEKSELLGRVVAALIMGKISHEEYERYAFIIDRLFLRDLTNLAQHYDSITEFEASRERGEKEAQTRFLDEKTIQALYGTGLLNSSGWSERTYHRNDLGEKLIQLIGPEDGGK